MTVRFWIVLFLLLANAFLPPGVVTLALLSSLVWVVVFGNASFRVPRKLLRWCAIPVVIFLVACIGAPQNAPSDVIKDAWYMLDPVLTLATGYMLSKHRENPDDVISAFVIASSILALVYISVFILHESWAVATVEEIRRKNGDAFVVTFLTPIILGAGRLYKCRLLWLEKHRVLQTTTITLCIIALVISLSRTWWLCTLVAAFTVSNLTRQTKRIMFGAFAALLVAGLIVSTDAPASTKQGMGFGDKIAGSLREIAIRDYSNATFSDINMNWRGFETFIALGTYATGTPVNWALGFGLGKLVDIGFFMNLNKNGIRYIPIFHNGYVFLLIKSGLVGVLLYVTFLAKVYWAGRRRARIGTPESLFFGKLQASLAVTFAVSTFVVTGFYNRDLLVPLILFLGFCLAPHGAAESVRSHTAPGVAPDNLMQRQ